MDYYLCIYIISTTSGASLCNYMSTILFFELELYLHSVDDVNEWHISFCSVFPIPDCFMVLLEC